MVDFRTIMGFIGLFILLIGWFKDYLGYIFLGFLVWFLLRLIYEYWLSQDEDY